MEIKPGESITDRLLLVVRDRVRERPLLCPEEVLLLHPKDWLDLLRETQDRLGFIFTTDLTIHNHAVHIEPKLARGAAGFMSKQDWENQCAAYRR